MHLTGDRLTIWSGDNLIKQLSDLQRKVSWSLQVQTTNSTLIQYNKYMYTVHNTYMFNNIYYIHSEPEKKHRATLFSIINLVFLEWIDF